MPRAEGTIAYQLSRVPALMTGQLDDLLLNLYACPTEPTRWPAVLDAICNLLGVSSTVLQVLSCDGSRFSSRRLIRDSASEAARDAHEAHFSDRLNPRLRITPKPPAPPGHIIRDSDLFGPGSRELTETRERLAEIQLGNFVSTGMPLPNNESLVLALHRHVDDTRDYTTDDELILKTLIPHLGQAFLLWEKLENAARHTEDLEGALDRMRCGVIVCDGNAEVLWQNRAAERVLRARDSLRTSGKRLTAASAEETSAMRMMIAALASAPTGGAPSPDRCLVLNRGSDKPVQILIQPLDSARGERRALVLISEAHRPPVLSAEIIARVFSLSPAESRLAAALCTGLTVNEYADAHGVTVGTARFQLKQVLAKTGARRQSDLIRSLNSSVVAQILQRPI